MTEQGFDAFPFLSEFWARWKLALGLAAAGAVVGLGLTYAHPPKEEYSLSVMVQGAAVTTVQLFGQSTGVDVVAGMLKNPGFAEALAKRSSVESGSFNLEVGPMSVEQQVQVSVSHPNQKSAKTLSENVIRAYREFRGSAIRDAGQQRVSLLRQQIREREEVLANLRSRLAAFQKTMKSSPASSDSYVNTGNADEVFRLKAQLAKVEKELSTRLDQLRRAATEAKNAPTFLPLESVRTNVQRLEQDLAMKSITDGPESPAVRLLKEQLRTAKAEFDVSVDAYIRGDITVRTPEIANLEVEKSILLEQVRIVEGQRESASTEAVELANLVDNVKSEATLLGKLKEQYAIELQSGLLDPISLAVVDGPRRTTPAFASQLIRSATLGVFAGLVLVALFVVGSSYKANIQPRVT